MQCGWAIPSTTIRIAMGTSICIRLARRPSRISAATNIETYDLSPKGERALFSARGDIFTAPIEKGPTRNLTHSSGAHDKWPTWSPDGSQIAFISDASGEEELYVAPQDGSKPAQQITNGGVQCATNRTGQPKESGSLSA